MEEVLTEDKDAVTDELSWRCAHILHLDAAGKGLVRKGEFTVALQTESPELITNSVRLSRFGGVRIFAEIPNRLGEMGLN